MEYRFNNRQTRLNEETKEKFNLTQDEYDELREIYNSIEFVRNLTNSKRKKVKDLEKDDKGRVKVDVNNPHILENMDYFRPLAICYKENGYFTDLVPSRNPQSPYKQFWQEQKKRCLEGYVREDGEWVTGYHYHYLNLSKILLTGEQKKGTKKADRIEDFPRFWDGDYRFFHYCEQAEDLGEHANLLKCRGRGFSFKGGSMDSRNVVWIEDSKSFTFASEKAYLDPDQDGIMGKTWFMLDFIGNHTPLPRARLKDTPFEKTLGYQDPKTGSRRGMLSSAIGTSLKDRPGRARGKRGKLIKFEESGVFPHLLTAWKVCQKSVEQGSSVFGLMLAGGTGGEKGANFEAAEELFYHGDAHNVYMLPNVYDKDIDSSRHKCSLFFPEYLNREGCYDKDGNSDVIKALIEVVKVRHKIKRAGSATEVLIREKAESCITPQEAVLRVGGTIFPIGMLKDYRETITPKYDEFISPHFTGRLKVDEDGKVEWVTDTSLKPVREYPIRDNLNKEGCIEIFEQPQLNSEGRPVPGRYIAGIDSFDDDHSTTNSLGCIMIYDLWMDAIVAEYTARPNLASDFYDNCMKLLMYYNAVANYENANKGIFGHFSNHNKLHLLATTPQILKDMELVKGETYGNKAYGTPGNNKFINAWGRTMQADWMKRPSTQAEEFTATIDKEEDAEERIVNNVHKIRSIGYIDEAIHWNPDGNFDRISAMNMVMIYREDRLKYIEKGVEISGLDDKWNDPYWDRAFSNSKKDGMSKINQLKLKTGSY